MYTVKQLEAYVADTRYTKNEKGESQGSVNAQIMKDHCGVGSPPRTAAIWPPISRESADHEEAAAVGCRGSIARRLRREEFRHVHHCPDSPRRGRRRLQVQRPAAATTDVNTATQESAGAEESAGDASLEKIVAMPDNVQLPGGRWKAGVNYKPHRSRAGYFRGAWPGRSDRVHVAGLPALL